MPVGSMHDPLDPPGWSLSDRVSTLGRRGQVVLVTGLVIGAVCAVGLWYRFHYGLWPGAQYPTTLHYCGRSYTEHGRTPHPASAATPPVTTLFHVYDYEPPFANSYAVYSHEPKGVHVGDTPTCTVALYLETGRNRFIPYTLEGSVG